MADGRRRSAAKQARRDARRRKRQGRAAERETPEEVPLIDEVREALDGGQPLDLLGLVSMLILATSRPPLLLQQPDAEDRTDLAELVAAFIDVRVPETTALLAVLGEMVADDDELRDRCRREAAARDDDLPQWLSELAQTSIDRAVRMSHVLGDGDELLIGVRLADGQELTCAAYVDHLESSELKDAFFVPENLATVVGIATSSNTDPDTSFDDLDLGDARAALQDALDQYLKFPLLEESDTWPGSRALVQWLVRLMPAGASTVDSTHRDSSREETLRQRFFASPAGLQFDDVGHRGLLELCIEEGTGDALRWSAPRLGHLLNAAIADVEEVPVEVQLAVPELLRAFVPFAHAESGIRQELTTEALTAIDEMADDYRAAVLQEARHPGGSDDDDEECV